MFRNLVIHSTAVVLSARTRHQNTFLTTDKHLCLRGADGDRNVCCLSSNVGIVYLAHNPMLTQLGLEFLVDTCAFSPFSRGTICIWESSWSQSLNCWCEGQPASHWQEGNTQALTCKMEISTLVVTFSIRSRHLAQGVPKSLAQTDSSGSLRVCKRKSLCSWVTFSSFLADPSERQPQSQAALHWGQECPDQGNARVGILWCYRDRERVADVPPWVGHLRLSSHRTLLQILPTRAGSFELTENGPRGKYRFFILLCSCFSVRDQPRPGDQRSLSLQHFQTKWWHHREGQWSAWGQVRRWGCV